MKRRLLFVIPAALLFGAVFDGLPYVYFQILRWVICLSAIVCALCAHESRGQRFAWTSCVFVGIAILFNPLAPIHLSRETWMVIYAITALFFISNGIFHRGAR